MYSSEELDRRFDYHAPDEKAKELHQQIRKGCKLRADRFNLILPENDEKYRAIKKLEEAMFWANASIARGPHT